MTDKKLNVIDELYWQYRNHKDPMDAIRAMRDKEYTVDEVRGAIDMLIKKNTIAAVEGSWLKVAVNMLSSTNSTDPTEDWIEKS